VLSPANGSFATVALRVFSQDLTPAPRCQDHTTSPSASGAFVRSAISVHRILSRVDDVAQRPSFGTGWLLIWPDLRFGKTEIFLQKGLDRANQLDLPQQIRFYAQIRKAVAWVERSPDGLIKTRVFYHPRR
jgi:hypothetical protein